MPDYRRARTPGATYFFTLVSYQRRPSLCDDPVRAALRDAITIVRREHPFTIDAWVLLPDHLHCIWTLPEHDHAYSVRWSMIKRLVTQRVGAHGAPYNIGGAYPYYHNGRVRRAHHRDPTQIHPDHREDFPIVSASRLRRREGAIWQRRFWEHRVSDQADRNRCIDYLHWNPVKHGHVDRVVDWPYSTFHRFVREGLYPEDWGGQGVIEDGAFGE
jgi:putative transposase